MIENDPIALHAVERVQTETVHRPFIIGSLLLGTVLGFSLGLHVASTRLFGGGNPEHNADLVQAHGQIQVLGFAGLYVIGVSLRLMPRFAGSRVASPPLVRAALLLIAGGLITRAVFVPWFGGDVHDALLLGSVLSVLLGSACFLFVTVATLTVDAHRFDGSSLAFVLGAGFFFLGALGAAFAAIEAIETGSRVLPYLADTAVLELFLKGFILLFILGVATRAIPTMVGVTRPGRSVILLACALAGSVAVLAVTLFGIEYLSFPQAYSRLAGVAMLAFGLVILGLVWQAGIFRQAANRLRPASQPNLWALRSAFVWLLVAAALSTATGMQSAVEGDLPDQFEFDAVRHALGLGVVTMLIVGMSLMIVPEFAIERQRPHRQRELAFLLTGLLNIAALLRVAPAVAGTAWNPDERNLSMTAAGSFAELALLIYSAYVLRLMWHSR